MAVFENTIDLMGEAAAQKAIIEGTLTEFNDNVLTEIGYHGLSNFPTLTSVNLPNVTVLGRSAFIYNSLLSSVNIPNVTLISNSAVSYCGALTNISLPSVQTIEFGAFRSCTSLTNITLPATPPTLNNVNAFENINANCVFHIPAGSLSAYQNATNWSTLTGQYTFTEDA